MEPRLLRDVLEGGLEEWLRRESPYSLWKVVKQRFRWAEFFLKTCEILN